MKYEIIKLPKFRGIPLSDYPHSGNWEYGGINADGSEIVRSVIHTLIHPETLQEFIGLYDVTGKELYTGEIVVNVDPKKPTDPLIIIRAVGECPGFYLQSTISGQLYPVTAEYNSEKDCYVAPVEIKKEI